MSWENIINLETLEFKKERLGEVYGYETAPLATKVGAKDLGFHVEILPPGQFSCPYHFHHLEEELFLVLEGRAMLRQASKFREVVKGDLIFFTKGPEGAHQFYNHTQEPFRFLALSTMASSEICEYPDSKKIMVGKLRRVFRTEGSVDYLLDEENPAKHWPKEYLE